MKFFLPHMILILGLALVAFGNVRADEYLESLTPNESVHGFKLVNLYDDASGRAMGARFMSEQHGFIVDVMQIQSVPQAFFWIKTPITGSRGEPHACEHLLLGKGNRGRYVAALEDMALGNSTAYTNQYRTCYHFNTTAGPGTFYDIFEAKMQALLHPDFTDEEIQREVCHIGVVEDPQTGKLSLDEKGTVYTEMVSSFERPYYHTYRRLFQMVYGKEHPLTFCAGGDPDVMREMVPQDMWDFHAATHHLANMGAIVSIPSEIPISDFLVQLSTTLDRCEEGEDSSPHPGLTGFTFPDPQPDPVGTTEIVHFPNDREEDPGVLAYSWPANLDLDYYERGLLDVFLETFGSGETSDLYRLFINSETRSIDLGASGVSAWIEDNFGQPIVFDVRGVTTSRISLELVDTVSSMLIEAVQRVHDYQPGSDELNEFNTRARGRLAEWRKQLENHLNQPPMFGFRRGPAGAWLSKMEDLEQVKGDRKSLTYKDWFEYVDSVLSLDENVWASRIDAWHLLTVKPYAIGAVPDAEMIAANEQAKEARLAAHVREYEQKYGVTDEQEALAAYKTDFDAKTAELEATYAKVDLPGFIDNPPMTLDDQLEYETVMIGNDVPLVASTFENMTASRVGLALRLDVLPENELVYVPFLPSALTEVGVVKDGAVVSYEDMQERLRLEVLSLGTSFSTNPETGRVELVLRGEGSNLEELQNAFGWMQASLFSSYLEKDNLPRILDRIDQLIQGARNTMRRSEESWVQSPATGYRYQENPLVMSAGCFLTSLHHLQRLRWMMTDPGIGPARDALNTYMTQLQELGTGKTRDELVELLAGLENPPADDVAAAASEATALALMGEDSRKLAAKVAATLKTTLGDIPDGNLADDWAYLCESAREDLLKDPQETLADLENVIALISHSDNARMFIVSNSEDRKASIDRIGQLVAGLDDNASQRVQYSHESRIDRRLASRHPGLDHPLYAGLVHSGTQNGVLMFTARVADPYDTSEDAVLNCLAGKLYGGGGPHGLFMRTWAAGLAYSNGYGYRQNTGQVSYYAERCPDVAETMRFVAHELSTAEPDSQLVEYAIAQIFGISRSPNRYEQRGEAIAADLADGITPERVRAFRQHVLDVRDRNDLFNELVGRMESAYGPVIVGYGSPLTESRDARMFLIGPEPQFESLQEYVTSTEGAQEVYRLYPRDFWLTL